MVVLEGLAGLDCHNSPPFDQTDHNASGRRCPIDIYNKLDMLGPLTKAWGVWWPSLTRPWSEYGQQFGLYLVFRVSWGLKVVLSIVLGLSLDQESG